MDFTGKNRLYVKRFLVYLEIISVLFAHLGEIKYRVDPINLAK